MGTLLFLLGAALVIFTLGWRKLPTDPPTYGVVTFIGRLTGPLTGTRREGWRWIIPLIQGLVPVSMKKRNLDISPEEVRTLEGDPNDREKAGRAEVKVTLSLTYSPDESNLCQFLFTGREAGVANIIEDVISEELRQYAAGHSWFELQAAQEQMVLKLALELLGRRESSLTEEEKRTLTESLRQGNGVVPLPAYGIVLNRLNVGTIEPAGELARAAEGRAKEEQERVGELYEVDTDLLKARQIVEAVKAANQTISVEEAYRIVMDYKATREGHGFAVPGGAALAATILRTLRR